MTQFQHSYFESSATANQVVAVSHTCPAVGETGSAFLCHCCQRQLEGLANERAAGGELVVPSWWLIQQVGTRLAFLNDTVLYEWVIKCVQKGEGQI